jgi:Tol biopolymer transport system component
VIRGGKRSLTAAGALALGALLAALAIALAPPSTGSAAFPGTNGRIAFTASHRFAQPCPPGSAEPRGLALEQGIFTMNPDGTDAVQLTDQHTRPVCNFVSPPPTISDLDPSFSPQGDRIAFTHSVDPVRGRSSTQIYMMGADGSGLRRLSTGQHDSEPAFFPTGNRIAFVREPKCGERQLHSMRTDGTHSRRLIDGLGESPSLFPGGKRIAFDLPESACVAPARWDVFTIGTNGAHPRQLTENGHSLAPDVSPSGRKVVFTGADDRYLDNVFVTEADGAHQRRLAQFGKDPVFSPAGGKIAFLNRKNGEIMVMDADGSDKQSVIPNPLPFGVTDPSQLQFGQPSWGAQP